VHHHTDQLELDVRDHPEALRRIITVCRRRDCRIVALSYESTPHGDAGRVMLRLTGEAEQTARLRSWLANLVDVLAVRA
jgi:acetolactate synthase regulatory subunit